MTITAYPPLGGFTVPGTKEQQPDDGRTSDACTLESSLLLKHALGTGRFYEVDYKRQLLPVGRRHQRGGHLPRHLYIRPVQYASCPHSVCFDFRPKACQELITTLGISPSTRRGTDDWILLPFFTGVKE